MNSLLLLFSMELPNYVNCIIIITNVLQGVTLGGTGKEIGDRHPKVGNGALLGACVTILGNIKIGDGAMIAAGSLVLKEVPPHRCKNYFLNGCH